MSKENEIAAWELVEKNIDLAKTNSIQKLARILKKNDRLVFISAIAPVKNMKMLIESTHLFSTQE